MKNIVLQSDWLTVEISPKGAELQRITDKNGFERLWDGNPAFWRGRAPVLFPVAGAFYEDRYQLDGKEYTMGKHGFARDNVFTVESIAADAVTFLLTDDMAPHAGFPFGYAFRVRFSVEGSVLHTEYITENTGDQPFYFGVGAHEAYACPEGIEAYEVVFEKAEPLYRHVMDGSALTHARELVPTEGNVLALTASHFDNDSLVFSGLASRSAILRSRLNNRQVRIDYADFDYLLLWTRPGAGYLCFEPWSNLPDFVDTDHDITKKQGMTRLAPGDTKTFAHTLSFS